ncbi:Uncharacterised protein [Salmonella bongori]|nr:Uncharacterised protein [Salmonella bongori]
MISAYTARNCAMRHIIFRATLMMNNSPVTPLVGPW